MDNLVFLLTIPLYPLGMALLMLSAVVVVLWPATPDPARDAMRRFEQAHDAWRAEQGDGWCGRCGSWPETACVRGATSSAPDKEKSNE